MAASGTQTFGLLTMVQCFSWTAAVRMNDDDELLQQQTAPGSTHQINIHRSNAITNCWFGLWTPQWKGFSEATCSRLPNSLYYTLCPTHCSNDNWLGRWFQKYIHNISGKCLIIELHSPHPFSNKYQCEWPQCCGTKFWCPDGSGPYPYRKGHPWELEIYILIVQ